MKVKIKKICPENPLALAKKYNKKFIYFHTHVVDKVRIQKATEQKKSIEFDVYTYPSGITKIQHPPLFYKYHNKPLTLTLNKGLEYFEKGDSNTILVLDAKSKLGLKKINKVVNKLGTDRVIIHGFAKELVFNPPPEGIKRLPHEEDEDLPLSEIVKSSESKGKYRAGVMVTCRYVTEKRLENSEKQWDIIKTIENLNKIGKLDGVDVIGLWLPGGISPPKHIVQKLLKLGFLISYNIDSNLNQQSKLDPPYIGMTNKLELATKTQNIRSHKKKYKEEKKKKKTRRKKM